jgi:uncharacterized delta-60 repeat protein
MKKNLLLLATTAFAFQVYGQNPGTLDKTFTTTGYTSVDFGGTNERANAIAVQPDGKIIVVGENVVPTNSALDQCYVARFDAKGVKDPAFGTGGISKLDLGTSKDYGRDVTLLSDGKILVLSSVTNTTGDMVVAKLTTVGQLDATFGTAGKTTIDNKSKVDIARSMAVQSDGKIVIGGESGNIFMVCRLTAAGILDNTFGTNGIATAFPVNSATITTSKVLIQKDGKIVLVGYGSDAANNTSMSVARFDNKGVLDASYGADGIAEHDFGGNEFYFTAKLQWDDKLILAGKIAPASTTATKYETFAARLTTAGLVDKTFGTNGYYREDLSINQEEMRGMDIQSDGKIVMAGYIGDDIGVVRLNTSGALEKTFNNGKGFIIVDVPLANTLKDQINTVKIDKNNKIWLAGVIGYQTNNENFGLARLYSGVTDVFEADNNTITLNVHPNPVSSSLSMEYEITIESNVLIELYDITGRKVAQLASGQRNAGKQIEQLEIPNSLNNGIYFCRVQSNQGASNTRLIINK